MSIYKKLAEIQKHVKGLGVDKQAIGYKYVTGVKVLEFIKPLMIEHGLLLKQEVLSIDNIRQDYTVNLLQDKTTGKWSGKPKSEILTKVMMKFTWIDVDTGEKDENLFGANGQNDWEKGLGSALTYAERYFLLKYFHIATDEDDIDNPDRKPQEPQKVEFDKDKTINWIIKVVGDDADKLEKQMHYHKIKSLNEATEIQLKAICKYLKPSK